MSVPHLLRTLTDTQLNDSSKILNVTFPEASTVLVNVIVGVGVGVGEPDGISLITNETALPKQNTPEGVGVGVRGIDVTWKLTSSQSTDGLGVGTGSQSQSKYALKSNVVQSIGVGVGVGQTPDSNEPNEISGHAE
jgi:hypothetical protein